MFRVSEIELTGASLIDGAAELVAFADKFVVEADFP